MIIKNIFKIHFSFYIFSFIYLITGHFKFFIRFNLIIIIHELGHIFMALIFKWNIKNVLILPFGGLTVFEEKLNKPLFEELLISIMGPIFQILFTILLNDSDISFISYKLLLFNLLPIYPLDGEKILNIIFNYIFNFKVSYKLVNIISLGLIIYFYFKFNLINYLCLSLLLYHLIIHIKEEKEIYNKFLLERYLFNFKFKKLKKVKSVFDFKRDHRHLINNMTEKEALNILFRAN